MSDRLIEIRTALPDNRQPKSIDSPADGYRERGGTMTDHEMNEMRRQLAWAQGWTEITTGSDGDLYGSPPGTADPDEWDTVPDPLERDRDAALLRAWVARQGWHITCRHDEGAAWWRVSDLRCQGPRAESMADAKEEPDYCRRERLALCRSVVQVLEAAES